MSKERILAPTFLLILSVLIFHSAFCYYGAKVEFSGSVDFEKLKYVKGCEVSENFGKCKISAQGYTISINFTQEGGRVLLSFVLSPDPQFTKDILKMELNQIIYQFKDAGVLEVNEDMNAILSRIVPLGTEPQVSTAAGYSASQVTPIVKEVVKELMEPYEPYITLSLKLFITLLVVSIIVNIISAFLKAKYEKRILNELREIRKLLESCSS